MSSELIFDMADRHTAVVTLNRPERGNAVNGTLRDLLNECWAEIRERVDIRSVVLTGAGERFFTTGLDLEWNLDRGQDPATDPHWPDIVNVWKPIVLAVNGICGGGGNHFMYQSDFSIGSTNAEFFEPHVSVGFIPVREALGLATRMPFGAAVRMAMMGTAERVGAEDALRLGLITEIVEPDALIERTLEVCAKINKQSPAAVRATKEILHKARGLMYAGYDTVQWGASFREFVHRGPDFIEGQRAFLEKREPNWVC